MIITTKSARSESWFIAPRAAKFDSFYVAYAEKLIYSEYFISLGSGWHQSKQIPAVFHAPGWIHGYNDDDVNHTPRMARH